MTEYAALAPQQGVGDKTRLIKLKDILNFISMMLFAAVVFSGTNILSPHKKEILIAGSLICLVSFFITNQKIRIMNATVVLWLYVILYMFASSMLHNSMNKTISFVLLYVACFMAMITGFEKKDYLLFIKICEIFAVVFAASVLLEFFVRPMFSKYLLFLMDSPARAAAINKQIKYSMFSGLSGERGEASYVANILIAIQLCRMFVQGKPGKKNILLMLLGIVALLLSGKRTMLMIPLVATLAFFFVNRIKGKAFKVLAVLAVIIGGAYILTMIFPALATTFDRIFNSSSNDILSGRGDLWNVCKNMFTTNPLFGRGFASFNTFANRDYGVGLLMIRLNHETWIYQAHSLYYQFLGELGLAGAVPAFTVIVCSFIDTLRLKKHMNEMDAGKKVIYHFSLYFQLWFIVYGFTGNVGYYPQDLIMYFLSVGMYLYLKQQYKTTRKPTDSAVLNGSLNR